MLLCSPSASTKAIDSSYAVISATHTHPLHQARLRKAHKFCRNTYNRRAYWTLLQHSDAALAFYRDAQEGHTFRYTRMDPNILGKLPMLPPNPYNPM